MEINHSSKCRPVLLWKQQLDAVSARSSLPITRIFTAVTSSSYLKVWTSTASRRVDSIKQRRKSYQKLHYTVWEEVTTSHVSSAPCMP